MREFAAAGLLSAFAIATGLAGTAGGAGQLTRDGVSVHVPTGWRVVTYRVNGVADPSMIFTASTFAVGRGTASTGLCSRSLQRGWRPDGAYVQLAEERDGNSLARLLRRAPPRPRRFVLDAHGWGGLCTPPNSGELTFKQHGRAFYVFYGIGREASNAVAAQAAALLDSMKITARR